MKTMKIADLVLDYTIYPRMNVDKKNVTDLREARLNGAKIPAILIDKKSKRVVDGFHRVLSRDPEDEIEVIERSYGNDREIVIDAIRYNSGHGAKFDSYDKTRCILLAQKLKISENDLSAALHISIDKLASLRTSRVATVGNLHIPLKRTIQHMAGRKLTKRQSVANEKLTGMNQKMYANQLIELLEANLIDWSDKNVMGVLVRLHGLIGRELKKRKAA